MTNLKTEFHPEIVTKYIHFPHSIYFHAVFKAFENRSILKTRDLDLNQQIEDFVKQTVEITKAFIKEKNMGILVDYDLRFDVEYVDNGLRVETLEPVIMISGERASLGTLLNAKIPQFGEDLFKFDKDFDEAFDTKAEKQDHHRNFLKEVQFIGIVSREPYIQNEPTSPECVH